MATEEKKTVQWAQKEAKEAEKARVQEQMEQEQQEARASNQAALQVAKEEMLGRIRGSGVVSAADASDDDQVEDNWLMTGPDDKAAQPEPQPMEPEIEPEPEPELEAQEPVVRLCDCDTDISLPWLAGPDGGGTLCQDCGHNWEADQDAEAEAAQEPEPVAEQQPEWPLAEANVQADGGVQAVSLAREQIILEEDDEKLTVEVLGFTYMVDKSSGLVFTEEEEPEEVGEWDGLKVVFSNEELLVQDAVEEEQAEAEAEAEAAAAEPEPEQEMAPAIVEPGAEEDVVAAAAEALAVETLTVECPEGVSAGDALSVMTASGLEATVLLPEGIGPGETFTVTIDPAAIAADEEEDEGEYIGLRAALHDYEGEEDGDLSFKVDEIVEVTSSLPGDGWWTGRVVGGDGELGIFPSNHVAQHIQTSGGCTLEDGDISI